MEVLLFNLLGWAGAVLLLLAYALVSFKKLEADSAAYQWLNVAASILLAVNTIYYQAYPSSFVNIVWTVIAFVAILTVKRGYGKNTN
jgi:phosphoglycerol transferase MdoB-like AlkP superfamily enzyme